MRGTSIALTVTHAALALTFVAQTAVANAAEKPSSSRAPWWERPWWERPVIAGRISAESKQYLRERCEDSASETVYFSKENVRGILRTDRFQEGRSAADFTTSLIGGSVHRGSLWRMFLALGLDFVEFVPPPSWRSPYARYDLRIAHPTRKPDLTNEIVSAYEVRFTGVTSGTDEALGVSGRRIEVLERASGKLLATRTEFFWEDNLICPTGNTPYQTPLDFLRQVINPQTFDCSRKFDDGMRTTPYSIDEFRTRIAEYHACQQDYFKKRQ